MLSPRRLTVVALLAFVAVSVAYLGLSPSRRGPETPVASGAEEPLRANQVVATYFHGTARCATCRRLESYAKEALHGGFPDELAARRLAWRTVDVSQPDNRHYATEYQLRAQSVVLTEIRDGNTVRWRNLDQIWQKVRDKDEYIAYVQGEVRRFMAESLDG